MINYEETLMNTKIRKYFFLILYAIILFATNKLYAQSDYPNSPVKMIVGFPAGGAVDGAGRMMAQILQKAFNQTFIIENRPGVGGMLAMQEVARAVPDGYTLAVGSAGPLTVSPSIFKKANFDPRQSLAPIIWFVNNPGIVVIRKDLPVGITQFCNDFDYYDWNLPSFLTNIIESFYSFLIQDLN